MHKAKSIAQEVSHARHKEDTIDIIDNVHPGEQNCKLKASNSHKGPFEFEKVEHVQELKDDQHEGPIWCMKFSCCGRLLATAGQDKILRIWVVRDAYPFFQDMRTKYNAEKTSNLAAYEGMSSEEASKLTFMPKPFCTYTGHTSDLLDVSWSKNYFILSSSMDKTVRLWHISRKECLCCFQHINFVTAIVFHPRDDRYFLSGSLDGKLRLWNIPDKKVGRKISGIEPMPGEDKILVTSNDSRIRLYDLRDLNVSCKYKVDRKNRDIYIWKTNHDYAKFSSVRRDRNDFWEAIKAHSATVTCAIFAPNPEAIIKMLEESNKLFQKEQSERDNKVLCVTKKNDKHLTDLSESNYQLRILWLSSIPRFFGGCVLISADFNGCIKVFINKTKA
ncbi:hypothetical protein NQ317_011462 [Molorchus minor]|uniref:WD repeat-containing protein 44 n=1 Tax=Molorchus minor TaxID=1323400 RepID=A0ABQ9JL37_9CUCU|nr:hypothetical protein NQ317_011462 [Molorchus minor]